MFGFFERGNSHARPMKTSEDFVSAGLTETAAPVRRNEQLAIRRRLIGGILTVAGLATLGGIITHIDTKASQDVVMDNPSHSEPGLIDRTNLGNTNNLEINIPPTEQKP